MYFPAANVGKPKFTRRCKSGHHPCCLSRSVTKNILTAVASTSVIVAATFINETVKSFMYLPTSLDSYVMYNATYGVSTLVYYCAATEYVKISFQSPSPRSTTLFSLLALSVFNALLLLYFPSILRF